MRAAATRRRSALSSSRPPPLPARPRRPEPLPPPLPPSSAHLSRLPCALTPPRSPHPSPRLSPPSSAVPLIHRLLDDGSLSALFHSMPSSVAPHPKDHPGSETGIPATTERLKDSWGDWFITLRNRGVRKKIVKVGLRRDVRGQVEKLGYKKANNGLHSFRIISRRSVGLRDPVQRSTYTISQKTKLSIQVAKGMKELENLQSMMQNILRRNIPELKTEERI
uniref:Uncharacterized protein n=1 Tax=Oryza punctata TaxID=4537 RepID=A0A0E0K8L8_ORYPU